MTRLRVAAVAVVLAAGLATDEAGAFDAAVDSQFAAQLYEMQSPFGSPIVRRRRYTHVLSLNLYDLQGAPDPRKARVHAVARLRLDADHGQQAVDRNPNVEERFVPGLQQAPLDLMVAYVEARGLLQGAVDVKAGRQYVIDSLGFWSFDGAKARISTPAYLALSGYGGFEQRAGPPTLSTSRFEADGVRRGDRTGLEPRQNISFLKQEKLAPAFGFAIESAGLSWLDARVDYRQVRSRDTVVVSQFLEPGGSLRTVSQNRTSTERLGAAVQMTAPEVGSVHGRLIHDLLVGRVRAGLATADWFASPDVTVGADYDYYRPTYDGDSIFNWFSHDGMATYRGRAQFRLSRRITLGASGGARRYAVTSDSEAGDSPDRETALDALGTVTTTYGWASGRAMASVSGQGGARGHRAGTDWSLHQFFGGGTYDATTRVSLYDFESDLRPERGARSLTYVLGGGVSPLEGTRAGVQWEHSINRLVGHRFRLLATLEVRVR